MPRSKKTAAYAEYMRDLFEAACVNPEGIKLEFPDSQQAMGFRNKCYAFINALEVEEREAGKWEHEMHTTRFRKVKIHRESERLLFRHLDFDPVNLSIIDQLQAQGIGLTQTEVEETPAASSPPSPVPQGTSSDQPDSAEAQPDYLNLFTNPPNGGKL